MKVNKSRVQFAADQINAACTLFSGSISDEEEETIANIIGRQLNKVWKVERKLIGKTYTNAMIKAFWDSVCDEVHNAYNVTVWHGPSMSKDGSMVNVVIQPKKIVSHYSFLLDSNAKDDE